MAWRLGATWFCRFHSFHRRDHRRCALVLLTKSKGSLLQENKLCDHSRRCGSLFLLMQGRDGPRRAWASEQGRADRTGAAAAAAGQDLAQVLQTALDGSQRAAADIEARWR